MCTFHPIKKHSFNLLCVLGLFFLECWQSTLCFRLIFFFMSTADLHGDLSLTSNNTSGGAGSLFDSFKLRRLGKRVL